MSQGNARSATDHLAELRSRTSPHGDFMQRMGHYCMEALVSLIPAKKCRRKSEDIYLNLALLFCSVTALFMLCGLEYLLQCYISYLLLVGVQEIFINWYCSDFQVAKLSGTGEQIYTVITNNHPSAATILKAFRQYVDHCPYIKITHFFLAKTTLDAFEGASHVHVIHYGILYGVEWPSLIQHLSLRPGGPPHFRMTGAA